GPMTSTRQMETKVRDPRQRSRVPRPRRARDRGLALALSIVVAEATRMSRLPGETRFRMVLRLIVLYYIVVPSTSHYSRRRKHSHETYRRMPIFALRKLVAWRRGRGPARRQAPPAR